MRSVPFETVGLPMYVARLPVGSIETRSLPTLTHCFPRNFTFYVAHPIRSIREQAGQPLLDYLNPTARFAASNPVII